MKRNELLWSYWVAVVASWVYSTRIEVPSYVARSQLELAIVAGEAPEPYRFRVLVPGLANLIGEMAGGLGLSEVQVHQGTYLLLNSFALTVTFFGIFRLTANKGFIVGLLAVLLLSTSLAIALYDHAFQPWSLWELMFCVVLITMVASRKDLWGFTVIVLASLNRETGVLLGISALIFLMVSTKQLWVKGRSWVYTLATIAGVGVVGALRLVLGPGPTDITIAEILDVNLSATGFRQFIFNGALLLGVMWLFIVNRNGPPWARHVLFSLLPFLPLYLVFGIWYEVRILLVLVWPICVISAAAIVDSREKDHLSLYPSEGSSGGSGS